MAINGIAFALFPSSSRKLSISGEALVLSAWMVVTLFLVTRASVLRVFKATASLNLQVAHQSAVKSTNMVWFFFISSLTSCRENFCQGTSKSFIR